MSNFIIYVERATCGLWLPWWIDSAGIEIDGQKVEFARLFCGFGIPSQRLFLFFNLDHVFISHGPNRKQMACAEEAFKESLKGLFQSCLMRGLFMQAEQGRRMSPRDGEAPWGYPGTGPKPNQ